MTDPSLDRAKWKELGLEGTSRMARSHEDKRVQLRRNKVSFPALTFEVSFFLLQRIKAHAFIIKQSSQTVGNGTFPRR